MIIIQLVLMLLIYLADNGITFDRYNPYVQARGRIDQLKRLGHSVDKVNFCFFYHSLYQVWLLGRLRCDWDTAHQIQYRKV